MSAVLVLLLAVPLVAALLCLATRSRGLVGTVEPDWRLRSSRGWPRCSASRWSAREARDK